MVSVRVGHSREAAQTIIHRAPTRPKPMTHRPAVGGASANLDRGPASQGLPMAAVALTVEAPLRRAIARPRPTAVEVHTGRVLRTAVAMAATAEGASCRAIAPATAVDTDQALRMVAEVLLAVAAARITAVAAEVASMVVA